MTWQAANPAKSTSTCNPPSFTTGVMATTEGGFDGPVCPEGTDGSTEPRPLAQIMIDSPADTGFVGLTGAPEALTAKIPGSCASNVTLRTGLSLLPFCTTRSTTLTSGSSNGTCALI